MLNLRNGRIMCVLPTGAVIKQNTSILEGDYPDGRRMIYFKDQDDIRAKAQELKAALAEWLSLIQK